ncbi:peptidoglycan DD-metalloendopeptidase family protein [Thermovenabulum gondwanense]|uniref:Murein DD-endopeptidase MepM n=1 Tax=Thermovenabulum gondwanense TaxID=520767 RepID=A0A162MIR6_9FIRM|nr:peptidoglycan DD-metalloendopeptidase family protein [Thermovenabulum gondwanense]KYO66161.1 Murein DD-endopeptidase MepM [Thermovenabulum gondwanense]
MRLRVPSGWKGKNPIFFITPLVIFLLVAVASLRSGAYIITCNGQELGGVKDKAMLEKAKQKLTEKYRGTYGSDIIVEGEFTFLPLRKENVQFLNEEELASKIEKSASLKAKAVAININGKDVAFAKNQEAARQILEDVKKYYVDMVPGELVKVESPDAIKLEEKAVELEKILGDTELKQLLINGTPEFKEYKVAQGDTLWGIAKKNGVSLEKLVEANPHLKSADRLSPGDKIYLEEKKPLLNFTVVKKVTYQKAIPYNTVVEKDSSMWKWDQKVKTEGREGLKELASQVIYKNGVKVDEQVLGEKIIREPVTKVVVRGTKSEVAFRGSGRFLWPITGNITSPYGKRGRDYHEGIDIGAPYGSPVAASNSGVVVFAGRNGAYGNFIIIDHGGGIQTYYAHLSKIMVSEGQRVEKGSVIGRVGSTGRSTGPHLHFEVRVNGATKNPITYLNK